MSAHEENDPIVELAREYWRALYEELLQNIKDDIKERKSNK